MTYDAPWYVLGTKKIQPFNFFPPTSQISPSAGLPNIPLRWSHKPCPDPQEPWSEHPKRINYLKTFLISIIIRRNGTNWKFARTVHLDSDIDHIFGWMGGTGGMQQKVWVSNGFNSSSLENVFAGGAGFSCEWIPRVHTLLRSRNVFAQ